MNDYYVIRRSVSGGVTGSRSSLCKGSDHRVLLFQSEDCALAYCRDLNAQRMHCRHHAFPELRPVTLDLDSCVIAD